MVSGLLLLQISNLPQCLSATGLLLDSHFTTHTFSEHLGLTVEDIKSWNGVNGYLLYFYFILRFLFYIKVSDPTEFH